MNLSQLQNALNLIHDYKKKNKSQSVINSAQIQSIQRKREHPRKKI